MDYPHRVTLELVPYARCVVPSPVALFKGFIFIESTELIINVINVAHDAVNITIIFTSLCSSNHILGNFTMQFVLLL